MKQHNINKWSYRIEWFALSQWKNYFVYDGKDYFVYDGCCLINTLGIKDIPGQIKHDM